jgi:hypothetical protein
MLYLKCTKAVQAQLGLRAENLSQPKDSGSALGNWYINRFELENRTAFLFMSESTLLSFILLEGKPFKQENIALALLGGLEQLLGIEVVERAAIEKVLDQYSEGAFAATDNQSLMGNLRNLAQEYKFFVETEGGLKRCDVGTVILRVNRSPKRRLGWKTAIEATHEALNETAT